MPIPKRFIKNIKKISKALLVMLVTFRSVHKPNFSTNQAVVNLCWVEYVLKRVIMSKF